MLKIEPGGSSLGARVTGVDLARPLSNTAFAGVLRALGEHGVLCFPDAGQDWHTDMTYNRVVGFVNVLVAMKVPIREGKALGATEFANTQVAYEDLPQDVKVRLAEATVTHDFNVFHEHMRRNRGSTRPALTEAQRRERPPTSHPLFLTHPITGRKVIYANPGFTVRINDLEPRCRTTGRTSPC